jgi:sulfur carrier protein
MTTTADMIRINGADEPLAHPVLSDLLEARGVAPDAKGIAVALNGRLVTRAAWTGTTLKPGDAVEIVQAKQGG